MQILATVLITGLGPIGLGGVVNLKFRGVKVIGVDGSEYRREKAVELGADLVLVQMILKYSLKLKNLETKSISRMCKRRTGTKTMYSCNGKVRHNSNNRRRWRVSCICKR